MILGEQDTSKFYRTALRQKCSTCGLRLRRQLRVSSCQIGIGGENESDDAAPDGRAGGSPGKPLVALVVPAAGRRGDDVPLLRSLT